MKIRVTEILAPDNSIIKDVDLVLELKHLNQGGNLAVYKALANIVAQPKKGKPNEKGA